VASAPVTTALVRIAFSAFRSSGAQCPGLRSTSVQVTSERTVEAPPRLRWWREVLYVLAFYVIYSFVRNQFGSRRAGPKRAFHHAEIVIRIEQAIGLFHEATIQGWFLSWHWFIRFWNVYYGTAHFVVTGGALIWCYRRRPHDYPLYRNTLAATTGLAIIGFSTFPLMPPRLLNSTLPFGGGALAKINYHFVDTLDKVGGLWSFDSGAMQKLSNQYAAMPSLHCGWALWVTMVMWPQAKKTWMRVLLVLYPISTLFCIIVTANHYWIDGVGGAITLFFGYLIGKRLARFTAERHAQKML